MADNKDPSRKGKVRIPKRKPGRLTLEKDEEPNPPRTTTGKVTAPKFGSAGSGGAELEPGPVKN